MNNIPLKLREEMAQDDFYRRCCLTGRYGSLGDPRHGIESDPIQWHHNLIFAGSQVQAKFAILPILRSAHMRVFDPETKARLDWIMWNRATDGEIEYYSKAENYRLYREQLNEIYGKYRGFIPEAIAYQR